MLSFTLKKEAFYLLTEIYRTEMTLYLVFRKIPVLGVS